MIELRPLRFKILPNYSMLCWDDEVPPNFFWLSAQEAFEWLRGQAELIEEGMRERIRTREDRPRLILPGDEGFE